MAFFKRLMDHMLNQVIVDTLAHSRWFQRFVVHTNKLSKEVTSKSKCAIGCAHRISGKDPSGRSITSVFTSAGPPPSFFGHVYAVGDIMHV